MKTPISQSIIRKITGYEEWAMAWKDYHMAKAYGIDGLSGKEEAQVIEMLRPDYHFKEIIH